MIRKECKYYQYYFINVYKLFNNYLCSYMSDFQTQIILRLFEYLCYYININ